MVHLCSNLDLRIDSGIELCHLLLNPNSLINGHYLLNLLNLNLNCCINGP